MGAVAHRGRVRQNGDWVGAGHGGGQEEEEASLGKGGSRGSESSLAPRRGKRICVRTPLKPGQTCGSCIS